MSSPRGQSPIAAHLRRAAMSYLFGGEFGGAKSVHWTTQWCSEEVVQDQQWGWIHAITKAAYESSPFYRSRFAEVGLQDVTREGFRRIPPITRAELVRHAKDIITPQPWAKLHRTSGASSGVFVSLPIDRETYGWYIAGTWRGLRWWGADFSERAVILLGGSGGARLQSLAIWAKDWVMNWLRFTVDDRLNQRAPEILTRIAGFGPAFIYGYPSVVHRLVRALRDQPHLPRPKPKVIVLTGEPVYGFQRRSIEETFECPVAEEYGNGELGSMGFECPERTLHITAENVYLETVPLVPPVDDIGGLILATQLRNRLAPLIRYETGDFGVVNPGPCRCRRGLPTLRVFDRARNRLVGEDGMTLARPRLELFFSMLPDYLQGRVQVAHGKPRSIVLIMERACGGRPDLAVAASVASSVFGADWHVGTVRVETFVRLPSGKLPYFVRGETHG